MNAYELSDELLRDNTQLTVKAAYMLRQQADRIAELENEVKRLVGAEPITYGRLTFCKNCGQQDPYTQTKPLIDEVLNKAFDYYCETDEGVLRFDFNLRTEWKQEQLQRWKEAFRKAWD